MQVTLNIPDGVAARVVDALCARGGYIDGNKNQFAKKVVIDKVIQEVIAHEREQAYITAATSAQESAIADIIIT